MHVRGLVENGYHGARYRFRSLEPLYSELESTGQLDVDEGASSSHGVGLTSREDQTGHVSEQELGESADMSGASDGETLANDKKQTGHTSESVHVQSADISEKEQRRIKAKDSSEQAAKKLRMLNEQVEELQRLADAKRVERNEYIESLRRGGKF